MVEVDLSWLPRKMAEGLHFLVTEGAAELTEMIGWAGVVAISTAVASSTWAAAAMAMEL